jgi:cell division septation protein DedD
MGYVIGRNTANASDNAPKRTALTDRPPESAAASPSAADTTPAAVVDVPRRAERAHVQEPVKTETVKHEIAKQDSPKREIPKPAPVEKDVDTSAPVGAAATAGHSYLQVMAVKRPVADSTIKMLKGHGLPALLAESSRADLYRVLVGPYNDTESLAKAKTELKKMGFDSFVSK